MAVCYYFVLNGSLCYNPIHFFFKQEADSEEPEEKCQCEECLLEERDTPTDLLSPREYAPCFEAGGDSCQSCHDDSAKRRSPKKSGKKRNKNGNLSPNDHSQDCGYSSGNNGGCCETLSGSSSLMSSPEGSEVACSEGFCNHERGDCLDSKNEKGSCTGFTLSLQEMLMVSETVNSLRLSFVGRKPLSCFGIDFVHPVRHYVTVVIWRSAATSDMVIIHIIYWADLS